MDSTSVLLWWLPFQGSVGPCGNMCGGPHFLRLSRVSWFVHSMAWAFPVSGHLGSFGKGMQCCSEQRCWGHPIVQGTQGRGDQPGALSKDTTEEAASPDFQLRGQGSSDTIPRPPSWSASCLPPRATPGSGAHRLLDPGSCRDRNRDGGIPLPPTSPTPPSLSGRKHRVADVGKHSACGGPWPGC